MAQVLAENLESQEAWDGVLFDRFLEFRHLVLEGLAPHGEAALRIAPPKTGDRVLDIGCGFGDSTALLADLVGPEGSAFGVDIAPRFIELAHVESAGRPNVRFEAMDVQAAEFEETFDYAFARFGTMFFANPVAALRNVRRALAPGGRLCIVVWRQREDNPWLYKAETVIRPLVDEPEETDEPRCGPGPFSMAGADTTSGILISAGFEQIALHRVDLDLKIGRTLDEAVAFNLAVGPAAEVVRLAGDGAAEIRPKLEALLREALAEFERPGGAVVAAASTWTVTARAPAA